MTNPTWYLYTVSVFEKMRERLSVTLVGINCLLVLFMGISPGDTDTAPATAHDINTLYIISYLSLFGIATLWGFHHTFHEEYRDVAESEVTCQKPLLMMCSTVTGMVLFLVASNFTTLWIPFSVLGGSSHVEIIAGTLLVVVYLVNVWEDYHIRETVERYEPISVERGDLAGRSCSLHEDHGHCHDHSHGHNHGHGHGHGHGHCHGLHGDHDLHEDLDEDPLV